MTDLDTLLEIPAFLVPGSPENIAAKEKGAKALALLSNSERAIVLEAGSEGTGVSLVSARERTQTEVKVPKYRLSVTKRASVVQDNWKMGLEAAIL